MSEAGPLSISDLAACTGLRPDTVRYYERVGLMPTPARTSGDHRRYGAPAVDAVWGGLVWGLYQLLGKLCPTVYVWSTTSSA